MTEATTFISSDKPELFTEFFESGMHESVSPFLTKGSRRWGRRLGLRLSFLAAFLLALAYLFSYLPGQKELANLSLLLSFFIVGAPALITSLEDLFNFEINIDILMTLGAFLAIPIGSAKEGALLLVLFALSGALEKQVRQRARSAISSLKKLMPDRVYLVGEDGGLEERAIQEVAVGAKIFVKAGEIVPLDGKVIAGSSSVNLAHLTGENIPKRMQAGDEVAAGAQNLEGSLTLEVLRPSAQSTLACIIAQITEAEAAKPRVERTFDRLSGPYAMTIIALALGLAIFLPLLSWMPYTGSEGSIYRSLTFLIAASPCALVIATPIAYLSAISSLARRGVILKGGVVLDALAKCRACALDKTGTITEGKLKVASIEPLLGSESPDRGLAYAYSLEQGSTHPMAISIAEYAKERGIPLEPLTDFRTEPGLGLEGVIGGKRVLIGNQHFISQGLKEPLKKEALRGLEETKDQGEAMALLLIGGESLFLFRFQDEVRGGLAETLRELKKNFKLKLWMLTGDHRKAAERVASSLPLDGVFFELRPEDKLRKIEELARMQHLAMVGDGINDAPALARATVGISMGKIGSRSAIDASDIVLLHDNLEMLNWIFGKAKETKKIVSQNLGFALIVILGATSFALGGFIPLWLAVILHEGGTVVVGLNALRLLRS